MVEPTINFPSGPNVTGVPDTVIGEPPGNNVFPSTTTSDEPSVKTSPPAVKIAPGVMLEGKLVVNEPTVNFPSDPKVTGVPEMVTGDPPGSSVFPSTTRSDKPSVKTSPPSVMIAPGVML